MSAAVDFNEPLSNDFRVIATDTTSRDGCIFGRLYIDYNSSPVNCVFYLEYKGQRVSRYYYDKETTGRWMYYDQYIPKDAEIKLKGRCDSGISYARIMGSFGAGCASNGGW